jgi:tRNA modification GTPase TrmE
MHDIIVALATPPGTSALAVIRLSGQDVLSVIQPIFSNKKIKHLQGNSTLYGRLIDGKQIIDEVVISLYHAPRSYTGEDMIEISCHGSMYIVQRIIELLMRQGARLATPGEFTKRAFMNGKLDLSQADAVADIIAAENESQLQMALKQMRGGYSETIEQLRTELIDVAALLELELDFSEEDVEFADRAHFISLVEKLLEHIGTLIQSFQWGNVVKKGIPVAIVGKPNAGKSTLLNALLNEEKAIVSEIAGTTRDVIEDCIQIDGILYRFIDTAGIRDTTDALEYMGIERTFEKIKQADIVLFLSTVQEDFRSICLDFKHIKLSAHQHAIIVLNKLDMASNQCDVYDTEEAVSTLTHTPVVTISAKEKEGIHTLLDKLKKITQQRKVTSEVVVSNIRHVEAFQKAYSALTDARGGLIEKRSGELIAIDIRVALQALGSITGAISSEDVLSSVFSRFCIGK